MNTFTPTNPLITFVKVKADSFNHCVSDIKEPVQYEVYLGKPAAGGILLGEVYSQSSESWSKGYGGRIRTGFRGYTRSWGAEAANGKRYRYNQNRTEATNYLLSAHQRNQAL